MLFDFVEVEIEGAIEGLNIENTEDSSEFKLPVLFFCELFISLLLYECRQEKTCKPEFKFSSDRI